MLLYEDYSKILKYFDKELLKINEEHSDIDYKLLLEEYFESSILSIDYIDIKELFESNGGISFLDNKSLYEQYLNLPTDKWVQVLINILNILKYATIYQEKNKMRIAIVSSALERNNLKLINVEGQDIEIIRDDILDSGSYCNIVKVGEGIVKKELKSSYKNDEKLNKRLKYEFENMKKLEESPYILKVFDFDIEKNTYLMEQGEVNLYAYLNNEKEISDDLKLKILMDILKGMTFAHENSIIHRDLHLGNILKIKDNFVICDFGLSKDISIERSLKTSYTEKNNHIFVDPIGFEDFTKLDKKSDIYSIGKIMEYIFQRKENFKPVIERCICMNRDLRYGSVKEVIRDIEIIIIEKNKYQNEKEAIQKVEEGQYDVQVHKHILKLVKLDKLNKFIVDHNLSSFASILLFFESPYQSKILNNILSGYTEATGFNGWPNYDIFARIAYNIYIKSKDDGIKKIAKDILSGCAEYRFEAQGLLEKIES